MGPNNLVIIPTFSIAVKIYLPNNDVIRLLKFLSPVACFKRIYLNPYYGRFYGYLCAYQCVTNKNLLSCQERDGDSFELRQPFLGYHLISCGLEAILTADVHCFGG